MNNMLIFPNPMDNVTNHIYWNYNSELKSPQALVPCGFVGFLIYRKPGALVLLPPKLIKKQVNNYILP
ncbi:hypothetical protein Desgi_3162 [Desulfoscipio gibsoniae DSM 7213]|uniref:Uncharacterized protein n=1 Tax=Desulfoscipio gibsoniae DSM 7213 TaxID=767817 RepID=R4KLV3_9FIRM|nr:hypothetical protein Desgi_3162 [Desulfoscipio gibsoniae DSM 7213]